MAKEVVLGIDLGTSYSCVCYLDESGKPQVIENEWGERTHASVVSFLDNGRIIVGNEAKRRVISDPEHTVYSAKRLIGRFYFSEEVKKAQAVCPYELVEGPNASVRIRIYDTTYSLPEISAMVLKELKAIAESHLGHEVKKAVVTVPAFFNDNQRQATKDAGRIAGLEILRMVNEPTCAAVAYGFGKENLNQRVVIYDFGGGTFDVSILELTNGVFEVVSTAGDTYLGGDDLDDRLMDFLAENFESRTGVDLRLDKIALQKLKDAAERAKRTLSTSNIAEVRVAGIVKDPQGRPLDLVDQITDVQFANMCMDIIQRSFKVCDEALMNTSLNVNQVDAVIMVGGPTRLPLLRQAVKHYFSKDPLTSVNPDEAVAIGAAIHGASLVGGQRDAMLLDVTPLTLRLATVGGYCDAIIPKNTPLPTDRTRTFTTSRDNQDRVKVRIYQGESNRSDDNESLGEFAFSGFRIAPRGQVQIEVTFEIDTDGIVNVSAKDVETGERQSMTLSLSSGLTEEDIQASIAKNQQLQLTHEQGGDADLPALR